MWYGMCKDICFIVYRLSIVNFLFSLFSFLLYFLSIFSFFFFLLFKQQIQTSNSNIILKHQTLKCPNTKHLFLLLFNLCSLFLFLSSFSFSSLFSFSSSFLDPVLIPVLVSCQPHPILVIRHSSLTSYLVILPLCNKNLSKVYCEKEIYRIILIYYSMILHAIHNHD